MSPRLVWGDITSDHCDCKQVTKKSPPVRHVVRHIQNCLEIKFRWNRTKSKFWRFRRPFPEKPEVGENFYFRHHVQRTRFTQKTLFQADPMKKVFSSFFSTAAILEMAAILKNSKTKTSFPNVQLSLRQVSCLSVEPFFQKVPDKFMGEEKKKLIIIRNGAKTISLPTLRGRRLNKKRGKNNISPTLRVRGYN